MYINEFVNLLRRGTVGLMLSGLSHISAMERTIFKQTFLCSSHLYILKLLF